MNRFFLPFRIARSLLRASDTSPSRAAIAAVGLAALAATVSAARAAAAPYRAVEIQLPDQRSGFSWGRFNDDERMDLLYTDDASFHILFQRPDGTFVQDEENSQTIPDDAGNSLYDLADLDGDGRIEIVAMRVHRVDVMEWSPKARGGRGGMVVREKPLVDGLRGVEIQHPCPADFLFDIDGDGDQDLVYPMDGRYFVFFQKDGVFTKENQVSTREVGVRMAMGKDALRGEVSTEVTIPRLGFSDLNGDGRLDLRASDEDVESFYLQDASGRIPETPSYVIDLGPYKKQAPEQKGGMKVGQWQFIPIDLNADSIQDYVIVAGNKIWFHLSGKNGPDLAKPDQILKVSTETMSVVMLPIDEDDRPDLVVMKYELPSVGRIVAGLAIGLDFEIEFLGYRNSGDPVVARKPDWRSTFVFKVPPIFRLLGELEGLTEEFRGLRRKANSSTGADFDGDGARDFVKLDAKGLEFYRNEAGTGAKGAPKTDFYREFGDAEVFRDLLFGEKRRTMTIDTMMTFMGDFITGFQAQASAGRPPAFVAPAPEGATARAVRMTSADLNADKRDDVVVFLGPKNGKEFAVDEKQSVFVWMSGEGGK